MSSITPKHYLGIYPLPADYADYGTQSKEPLYPTPGTPERKKEQRTTRDEIQDLIAGYGANLKDRFKKSGTLKQDIILQAETLQKLYHDQGDSCSLECALQALLKETVTSTARKIDPSLRIRFYIEEMEKTVEKAIKNIDPDNRAIVKTTFRNLLIDKKMTRDAAIHNDVFNKTSQLNSHVIEKLILEYENELKGQDIFIEGLGKRILSQILFGNPELGLHAEINKFEAMTKKMLETPRYAELGEKENELDDDWDHLEEVAAPRELPQPSKLDRFSNFFGFGKKTAPAPQAIDTRINPPAQKMENLRTAKQKILEQAKVDQMRIRTLRSFIPLWDRVITPPPSYEAVTGSATPRSSETSQDAPVAILSPSAPPADPIEEPKEKKFEGRIPTITVTESPEDLILAFAQAAAITLPPAVVEEASISSSILVPMETPLPVEVTAVAVDEMVSATKRLSLMLPWDATPAAGSPDAEALSTGTPLWMRVLTALEANEENATALTTEFVNGLEDGEGRGKARYLFLLWDHARSNKWKDVFGSTWASDHYNKEWMRPAHIAVLKRSPK